MTLSERFQHVSLWKRIGMIVLSAVLGVLIYAPFSLSYVSLIAWLPLMLGLSGVSLKVGTRLGFLYGVLFFGGTMGWLMDIFQATPWSVVPLVVILSLFPAIWALGYVLLQKRFGFGEKTAVFAALWWGGVEFFRSELFVLKFSWMTPGMGIGPTVFNSVIGVYGVSTLIVLSCLRVLHLRGADSLWGAALLGLVCIPPIGVANTADPNDRVKVLAVQAEFASFQRYKNLIAECSEDVDFILLPEYTFSHDISNNVAVMRELKEIAKERDAILVFGSQTNIEGGKHYNTAVVLDETGVLGTYYKNNPVHFFDDGEKGTEAKAIETRFGKVGTPICFDNDYEDVVRRMAADGATMFLVPSLDAKHWGERQHLIHSEVFRHRAVESGKWFVVAAGSGMTQVIRPDGLRVKTIPLMDEGWMVAEISPMRSNTTLYTKFGWLFPWFCLVSGLGVVIYSAVTLRGKRAVQS